MLLSISFMALHNTPTILVGVSVPLWCGKSILGQEILTASFDQCIVWFSLKAPLKCINDFARTISTDKKLF